MQRNAARAAAMQLIYEWDMGGEGGRDTVEGLLNIPLPPADAPADDDGVMFMNALVDGVKADTASLDEQIARFAVGWRLERINKVDLAIMRLAICEIAKLGTAPAVAVNEAVELAHTYSTPQAASFINGVLGSYIRSL